MAATGTLRAAKDGRDKDALRRAAKLGCDETEEAAKYGSDGVAGVKKGRLRGGEIRGEGGVYFFTTGEGTVYYTDAIDLGFDALDSVGLAVDILLENVTNTFAVDVETGKELLSTAKRCTVVDGDTADHDINALTMKVFETDADTLDELMTGDLKVVLIVGIVDNSLYVAFVVARLQL